MADPQLERAVAGGSRRPSPALDYRLMTSLSDAMVARRLRNSCARYMTNAREPIGRWAQARWYVRHYRRAVKEGRFRVYLFFEAGESLGYGALLLKGSELHVTECVAVKHRGRGIGGSILEQLIAIARHEGRDLVAEIWTSNGPSIGLHEKVGFALEKTAEHRGESLSVYRLSPDSPEPSGPSPPGQDGT